MKYLRWTLAAAVALSLTPAMAISGSDSPQAAAAIDVSSISDTAVFDTGRTGVLADTATAASAPAQPAAAAAPAGVTAEDVAYVRAVILGQTNEQRAAAGLGPLAAHGDLDNIAQRCSDIQAGNDVMAHCEDYYTLYPAGWLTGGENVAFGQTPETVVAAWMASAGHRDNILNPTYTHIGIGVNRGASGALYYTQDFAGF